MPKFRFQNREMPVFELAPEGDYEFVIKSAESSLSDGGKTKGCDQIEMQVDIGKTVVPDTLIFPDYDSDRKLLTDAKAAKFLEAKIDCFLKSTGVAGDNEQDFEITAEQKRYFDITTESVVDLRGWCHVVIEDFEFTQGAKKGQKGQSNKVKFYITNKPRLAPNEQPVEAPPF